ncbi:MAG: SBBP repeat-containing protein, partial [Bacteroidales bacterium]|nr:SBBP repeat-containing protein [Bacteroidales bacterium]
GNVVSYSIPDYDRSKTLYIDPGLVFSTYIGSHSDSWGMTSCYDNYGMMISGGIVHGAEYPYTEGSYDTLYNGDWDCVVTKYDTLGHNLVFSTFLGGNKGEMPHSMICNQNDEILVFGTTGSTNFPTSDNAFQTQMHNGENLIYEGSISYNLGSDIFVACLNSNGNDLVASTLIGGSANDGLNYRPDFSMRVLYDGNDSLYYNYGDIARGEIITDSANNVYVASCTFSTDFPITNGAFQQQNNGGQEAVIFKFDHSLSSLLFSTYLGGNNNDASYSLDIDNQGKIYVCGGTTSANFPTTPLAYNTTFNGGSTDAFISIFSNDGTSLIASTFYGSNAYDQSYFIKVDKDNCPHIFG